jgi:hypothetical protein
VVEKITKPSSVGENDTILGSSSTSSMRMEPALVEFRQQLPCQSGRGFQTAVVGNQLTIDPDTMHTCGQGV